MKDFLNTNGAAIEMQEQFYRFWIRMVCNQEANAIAADAYRWKYDSEYRKKHLFRSHILWQQEKWTQKQQRKQFHQNHLKWSGMKTANYVNIIYGENVTEFICKKDVNQQLKKKNSFHTEIRANQFKKRRTKEKFMANGREFMMEIK